jgi:hypothetical protein
VAAVQMPLPDTRIVFDVDPKNASKNRNDWFKKWAHDRTLIAVPHVNYPGVGYLKAEVAGFRWQPIPYSNRATD